MELNKRKYAKKEVEIILNDNRTLYENKLFEQKVKIQELNEENKNLKIELENLKSKQTLIDKALITAETQSKNIQEKAILQYQLTAEKLKNFYVRWSEYFRRLKIKYPLYPEVKESAELLDSLKVLFKAKNIKTAIDKIDNKIVKKSGVEQSVFNPKSKISAYVAATSDNGFNLDEVLNPGELQLEDLCKELGLIEE